MKLDLNLVGYENSRSNKMSPMNFKTSNNNHGSSTTKASDKDQQHIGFHQHLIINPFDENKLIRKRNNDYYAGS